MHADLQSSMDERRHSRVDGVCNLDGERHLSVDNDGCRRDAAVLLNEDRSRNWLTILKSRSMLVRALSQFS